MKGRKHSPERAFRPQAGALSLQKIVGILSLKERQMALPPLLGRGYNRLFTWGHLCLWSFHTFGLKGGEFSEDNVK